MCFNGAKSWELGWYNHKAMTFVPSASTGWSGRLVGIAEHDLAEPNQGEMVFDQDRNWNRRRLLH